VHREIFKKSGANKRRLTRSAYDNNRLDENDEATKRPFKLTTQGPKTVAFDGQVFSESKERNVEVMVVADRSMMDFHDKESATDLETYLLTVMNMV
jgi:hypothetical protein